MFITCANSSLNIMGNLLHSDDELQKIIVTTNDPWSVRGDQWCQGLKRCS